MTALATSLLDVSRVMGGQFDLTREEVHLDEVVRDVTARFRDQAAAASCELVVEVADVPAITSDRMRLEQILTNLLANALKFGAGKPIDVKLAATSSDLVLRVRDHGIGIARRDHERIFRRFERAGERGKGLGLGLWIVQQIVTAMHGTIAVESEPAKGATFIVTLPKR